MKTLGIFIGSDRHSDYLWALVGAVGEKGPKLHIHFFGSGVRLVPAADFDQLPVTTQVTICRESAAMLPQDYRREAHCRRWLVPQEQMARIIRACDRHLFL
jgi:hypothetical protein